MSPFLCTWRRKTWSSFNFPSGEPCHGLTEWQAGPARLVKSTARVAGSSLCHVILG